MVDSVLKDRFERTVFCRRIREFIKRQNKLLLLCLFADKFQRGIPVGKGTGRIRNAEKAVNLSGEGSQVDSIIGFLRRKKDSRLVLDEL